MLAFIQLKITLLIKVFRMPIRVILFRIYQTLRLKVICRLDLWRRIQKSTVTLEETLRQNNDITNVLNPSLLISIDVEKKLQEYFDENEVYKFSVRAIGETILSGRYELLGSSIPSLNKMDWHSDWRFGKRWEPKYFSSYSFYGERETPYDVKYPWELSRLQFVIPLLENAVLFPEESCWFEESWKIITDWKAQNPLANSVAWYPMEASMRLTCLVQLLDMTLLLTRHNGRADGLAILLCKMIAEHGHFVWETREYTAQRGNHYAANISGLCVAGLALRNVYPEARKWLKFSNRQIQKEVITQFYDDGVNFEKSTGYHRLVTELFLISLVGLEKAGFPIKEQVKKRIHHACVFANDVLRPDGMSVNFGDNDNAVVFNFSARDPRQYTDFLNIAAVYFDDYSLLPDDGCPDFAPKWFDFGLDRNITKPIEKIWPLVRYYKCGGYVVVRDRYNHLVMDVGEVGQYGLGGHGHNDLFSFELSFSGQPVIIDPGCPIYTGDQEKRNNYRSSFSHNIATIDQREIANMPSFWRIENTAIPMDVSVDTTTTEIRISGMHTGYQNLASPVTYHREIITAFEQGVVRCMDRFEAQSVHKVCRRFTLSPDMRIEELRKHKALLKGPKGGVEIMWGPTTKAELKNIMISNGFGSEEASMALVLSDEIAGRSQLEVVLKEKRVGS